MKTGIRSRKWDAFVETKNVIFSQFCTISAQICSFLHHLMMNLRRIAPKSEFDSGKKKMLIRVFGGGEMGWQIEPFEHAIRQYVANGTATCEIMHVKEIKKRRWGPHDFINWLLESDAHFIITHLHQGIPKWDINEILDALGRLYYHLGFPTGQQLFCPIFTQNKLKYLVCLPSFMRTPTLALPIKCGKYRSRLQNAKKLQTFLENNDEGCGWVVKLPFVTNREEIRFCKEMGK